MEIIRVIKNKNYSVIANGIFRDQRISLKAKGLLGILLSLPQNWNLSIEGLTKITKEGRHSITNTITELIENGYIERNQIRDKGKFVGYQYLVMEKPNSAKPITVKPLTNKPIQLSKENNKVKINKDIIETLKKEVQEFDTTEQNKVEFLEYWLETSRSGKTKFEMQKTWCTKRRIRTWIKNQNSWYQNKPKNKIDSQINSWMTARELIKKKYEN
jgi:predicted transcriptional regulator